MSATDVGPAQRLVFTVLRAIRTGRLDEVRPLVAPDFTWRVPGHGPISGEVRGLDAWAAKLTRLLAAGLEVEVERALADDTCVVTVQHNRLDRDGARLDQRVLTRYHVEGGTLTEMETYFSDQDQADRAWAALLADGADAG